MVSEIESLRAEVASLRAQLRAVHAAHGPAGQPGGKLVRTAPVLIAWHQLLAGGTSWPNKGAD